MAKRKAAKATTAAQTARPNARPPRRPNARPQANGRRDRQEAGVRSRNGPPRRPTAAKKRAAARTPRAKSRAKRHVRAKARRPARREGRHGSTARAGRSKKPCRRPPSSLNMDRHGSAARTGRAEIAEQSREHHGHGRDITGGDLDVDVEDAYFTGDEAPGGDNPTPDQDIVDDIGKALGVEYEDNEELKARRQGHRARQAPVGAGSGLVGGLQGAEVEVGR